jgi:pullulanase
MVTFFNIPSITLSTALFFCCMSLKAQYQDESRYPVYNGNDLGLLYSPSKSSFKIWAPTADSVLLTLYKTPLGYSPVKQLQMQKTAKGIWQISLDGNHVGLFYTFRCHIDGKWNDEVPDPYAKLVGVNGRRGYIGDSRKGDPKEWENDKRPASIPSTASVIYELHVRDASIHPSSGIKNKGKFKGLTEKGSTNEFGESTGLDHLKELGITHVHLLPSYDFFTIDETRPDSPQYNWGYDPLNYNVPEGSYSTDAQNPYARIKEFKELIKTFHDNNLRVVMDVVYNHTMLTEKSWFNQLVPGYYYRQDEKGGFSNASACNNETASERPMMRKFILESLEYWVKEFHVDGFRFDLMGIHDIETMNKIASSLRKLNPDILLYGEGWTAGKSPLPDEVRALKKNAYLLDDIAVFSDDLRDGIKGSVFEHADKGFATGKPGMEASVMFGIAGAVKHPQVDVSKVNYSKDFYANSPKQVVSYCECHDNHVLWDKIRISNPNASFAEHRQMHKLALAIVLTSQGISFIHAGTELLRSKQGVENSFQSPDSINAIDWNLKHHNKDVYEWVKELILMRKTHPAFQLQTGEMVRNILHFIDTTDGLISYVLDGKKVGDSWKKIYVAFNGTSNIKKLQLPKGNWHSFVQNNQLTSSITLPSTIEPFSAIILFEP